MFVFDFVFFYNVYLRVVGLRFWLSLLLCVCALLGFLLLALGWELVCQLVCVLLGFQVDFSGLLTAGFLVL